MSGKRQYDEQAVIAAALTVFWRDGYGGASINNLTAATGLSRSSIYQRFGDKDGLFNEAVLRYTEAALKRMRAVQGDTPRQTVHALLREFVRKENSQKPAGCLLGRSCSEFGAMPDASRQLVEAGLAGQRVLLEELVRAGIAAGELAADTDPTALAWYYIGITQAVLNLPEAGASRADIDRMVETAMLAWR